MTDERLKYSIYDYDPYDSLSDLFDQMDRRQKSFSNELDYIKTRLQKHVNRPRTGSIIWFLVQTLLVMRGIYLQDTCLTIASCTGWMMAYLAMREQCN